MEGATTATGFMAEQDPIDPHADGCREGTPDADGTARPQIGSSTDSSKNDEEAGGAPARDVTDPPEEIQPRRIVEAILFAADAPVPAAKIAAILGVGTARDARQHIAALNEQYAEWGLSFRIEEIARGFQMLTLPAYNTWLARLLRTRQEAKLSQAAMETLAVVAYKQPCTRADIEVVRGVAAGDMLNRLREMNLVKIVGRAEDLGRPLLYGTTKRFLELFGLPSLEDLPQVEALRSAVSQDAPARSSTAAATNGQPDVREGVSETAEPGDDEGPREPDAEGPPESVGASPSGDVDAAPSRAGDTDVAPSDRSDEQADPS